MLDITVLDADLKAAIKRLERAGRNVAQVLRPTMRDKLANVMGEAKNKTPVAEASLRRSGQSKVWIAGNEAHGQIMFGGLAAAYAEKQHESEGFRHTLPPGVSRTMTTRKYRVKTERMTGRVNKTTGEISITYSVKTKLKPRKRKHPLKGYRGGQAHFLYGAADSAWTDTQQAELLQALLRKAAAEVDAAAGGG